MEFGLIFGLVVGVLIFLLLREFFCWYFKINRRLAIEMDILRQLRIANGLVPDGDTPRDSVEAKWREFNKAQDPNQKQ